MAILSSAIITKNSLFRQTHANVYNLINTNVPDPNDSSGVRKFVYVREPRTLGRDFLGYPIIVVNHVELSQDSGMVSGTKEITSYDIDIRIYTSDKTGDSSGDPTGAETLDVISDNVIKTLNGDDTLRNYGMKNMSVTGSYDWTELGGKTVFVREITLSFTQRQTTS